jgi:3D (Asp-Asp-Asp) domain-containing protein
MATRRSGSRIPFGCCGTDTTTLCFCSLCRPRQRPCRMSELPCEQRVSARTLPWHRSCSKRDDGCGRVRRQAPASFPHLLERPVRVGGSRPGAPGVFEVGGLRATREPSPTPLISEALFVVSAYCASAECGALGSVTAMGAHAVEGRTVACPVSMAMGTRLWIDGVGERTCEDRGSAITERRLLLFVGSNHEPDRGLKRARMWGRRVRRVRVLWEPGWLPPWRPGGVE